jgi:hypothetical protein
LGIAKWVREKLPTSTRFLVGIKLNSVKLQAGGFSADECGELCNALKNEG